MERKEWKKEDLERLRDLLSRGYTYKEIAAALGRSYDSIRGIVKRIRRGKLLSPLPESRPPEVRERGGGKRSRGLLDMTNEEAASLLIGGEKAPDDTKKVEKKEDTTKDEGGLVKRSNQKNYSSSWVLSDQEVSKVIERYLKRTRNIEGAKNLWKLHLQYKRRYSQYGD